MRIPEYLNLIVNEETEEISLKNCPVVIDGLTYLYKMYKDSEIPFVFGCETNKCAEYLKKQFTMYKQANVKCYILFECEDFFDFNTNCFFVPPILLIDATVEVLHAMDIDYVFCVTDTKDECVALALDLECPIISYDIEYCFRRAPYIPFTTMKFDDRTKSIQCRLYQLQNFLQKNSLTEEKTAIFAALTDTTVYPSNFYDSLLQTWGVVCYPQHRKLRHLIMWLSKQGDTVPDNFTNWEDSNEFWSNYDIILENMEKSTPGCVINYLLESNIQIMKRDPKWFEKGVVCKHVPPVYINLYKKKVIGRSWAINKKFQNSIFLSIDIIKYAYNLLTNYKRRKFKVYQNANKYIDVLTDDPNVCKPVYDCKKSVFENGWDDVKQLKLFEHFLTEKGINTEVLAKLPPDYVVLFTALVYFSCKKELKGEDVTKEVYAVVLSYVLLSLEFNIEIIYFEDHLKIENVTAKYFQYDEKEAKRIFDAKISKNLAELQFCIQHMNYLNTLCGSPYKSTQYRNMYNGTFIYKICSEMRDRNVEDFINELFQTTPKLLVKVKMLIQDLSLSLQHILGGGTNLLVRGFGQNSTQTAAIPVIHDEPEVREEETRYEKGLDVETCEQGSARSGSLNLTDAQNAKRMGKRAESLRSIRDPAARAIPVAFKSQPGPIGWGVVKREHSNDTASPSAVQENPKRVRTKTIAEKPNTFALATKNIPARFAVAICFSPPSRDLTHEEATLITTELERLLMESDLTPLPAFRGFPRVADGTVQMWCEDENSLTWLTQNTPRIRLPDTDSTLTVKRQSDIPTRVRAALFIPRYKGDIARLQSLLIRQNSWYDIGRWSLYKATSVGGDNHGTCLTLGIPADEVEKVLARERRISYLFGTIRVCFYPRTLPTDKKIDITETPNPTPTDSDMVELEEEMLQAAMTDAKIDAAPTSPRWTTQLLASSPCDNWRKIEDGGEISDGSVST